MTTSEVSSLRSMTGFGSARREANGLQLDVEVRSVNHRHLKVSSRLPDGLLGLSPRLEALVRERVARGTVYLVVRQGHQADDSGWRLDRALLERLHGELVRAAMDLGTDPPPLGAVAALPGVVRQEETTPEADRLWPHVEAGARDALDALDAMRHREGQALAKDLSGIADELAALADAIAERTPAATQEEAERLRSRVHQLLAGAPGSLAESPDLAREVALLAEKTDISEELQRLRSHLDQLREAIAQHGPVGRKLEFLAQELLREANTMASKSHDAELMKLILSVKLGVERIREQAANVE